MDVKLSSPGMPGNGTNPEQLFAAGWSACFMGAMGAAAAKMKTRLPADAAIDAEVDLWGTGGEYFSKLASMSACRVWRAKSPKPWWTPRTRRVPIPRPHGEHRRRDQRDVPSIGLVVAGDVVYNGVHQYLAEATNGGLRAWMKGLDIVAALQPRHVVAGHKNKALQDDPKTIDETRRCLEDAERLISSSHTAREFYDAMLKLYPDRLNPGALWFWSARGLFPRG